MAPFCEMFFGNEIGNPARNQSRWGDRQFFGVL